MNGIQIQIIGAADSGKTRVAQEIVDTLRNKGLAVKWEVTPDFKTEAEARLEGIDRLNALENVSDKSTIIVKEVRAFKDFNASLNYRVNDYNE
jgi:molybdopterin-guanine dinucleotide biosynthesis protein